MEKKKKNENIHSHVNYSLSHNVKTEITINDNTVVNKPKYKFVLSPLTLKTIYYNIYTMCICSLMNISVIHIIS